MDNAIGGRRANIVNHVRASEQVVSGEVCVVGAGLAGLTTARSLVGAGSSVVLVEGGEWESDRTAQSLADAEIDSRYYVAAAVPDGRRRQFGGTANDWTHVTKPGRNRAYARSLPGEPIDFERKPWMSASGWPIDRADLQPFYDAAQRLWIGHPVDNAVAPRVTAERPALPLHDDVLTARMAQYGPNDVFVTRFRDDLVLSGRARILVGATVVDLRADAGIIRSAVAVRRDGTRLEVRADRFVLAGGGVETVQTLLGTALGAAGGAANRHGVIGRYVMDHPEYRMARLVPADPGLIDRLGLYDIYYDGRDGQMTGAVLSLSEEVKRAEGLLNVGAVLVPQPAAFGSPAERALRVLQAGELDRYPAAVGTVLRRPRETAAVLRMRSAKASGQRFDYPGGHVWHRGGWSRADFDRSVFQVVELHAATEQTPEHSNRLELGDRLDATERRRVRALLHWSKADRSNLDRTVQLMKRESERAGLGRFEPWVEYHGSRRPVQTGWHHPMGGTRMHEDARHGVVDADCRVHGTANLWIAGSSVFPTSLGYSNPTLTVLALALRLGQHLTGRPVAAAQRDALGTFR